MDRGTTTTLIQLIRAGISIEEAARESGVEADEAREVVETAGIVTTPEEWMAGMNKRHCLARAMRKD